MALSDSEKLRIIEAFDIDYDNSKEEDFLKWCHIHHEYDTENQHATIIDIIKDMNEDEYEALLRLLYRSCLSFNKRACDNKASFDCPDLG